MNPNKINKQICEAIGVDPDELSEVTITLTPGQFPTISVKRYLTDADMLTETFQVLAEAEEDSGLL